MTLIANALKQARESIAAAAKTPTAAEVKNLFAQSAAGINQETERSPNIVDFMYFAKKDSDRSESWSVNPDITTVVGMEWRNIPYLVIQGSYTPICFNLRRVFLAGADGAVGYGMKELIEGLVFMHMDPKDFPTEGDQQNLLIIAGKGDPRSGQ